VICQGFSLHPLQQLAKRGGVSVRSVQILTAFNLAKVGRRLSLRVGERRLWLPVERYDVIHAASNLPAHFDRFFVSLVYRCVTDRIIPSRRPDSPCHRLRTIGCKRLICIFVAGEHIHTTFHFRVDKKLCLR